MARQKTHYSLRDVKIETGIPARGGLGELLPESIATVPAPPGLLQLAEEDRELIRNLTEALRDVADKLHALLEGPNDIP